MNNSSFARRRLTTAVALITALQVSGAAAQRSGGGDGGSDTILEEVITIGTRTPGRSALDSPAPVDVISGDTFQNQAGTDMANLLRTVVPSLNVSAQPISDASTFVRPVNLRGLSTDHTLVLMNGKRRHRSSVINFYTAGDSNGAQGPDISVFPAIALKRVEVLRDGAAAQYGSDAIAGVLNFELRDEAQGGTLEAKYGSTYEGDGENLQLAGNIGLPLTSAGFANLSFAYNESDPTDRSVQRADAASIAAAGVPDVPNPAQVWGSPEVDHDFKFLGNFGLDLSDSSEVYAFGNYMTKEATNGLYYRNPWSRGGVYTNGDNALVGDLDGVGTGIDCPTIAAGDEAALAGVIDDSTPVGANCFVFNEIYRGGFTPSLTGEVMDLSGVAGIKGVFDSGITYDVSLRAGLNESAFSVNSINASHGPGTQLEMDAGTFRQSEQAFNADFSYPVAIDAFYSDLNIAAGVEWRNESFEAIPGDPQSYDSGPLASQGFSGGSQGYVGLSNRAAGEFDRSNIAAYVDLEADVTASLLLGAALRWEDFEDFGSTTNFKLSARWAISDAIALRSTYSTGFRAPTPGQANIVNVSSVLQEGQLVNSGIVPPTTPLAVLFGGQPLDPEESTSFSIGTVLTLGQIDITLDYFDIDVEDRITLSSFFSLTPEDAADLEQQGISGAGSFANVRYYTNDFATNTRGVDVVATWSSDMWGGLTDVSLTANWTDTSVEDYSPGLLDNVRIRSLEDGLPEYRGNFTFNHSQDNWRVLARLNYYGEYYNAHLSFFELEPGEEFTVDLEAAYDISDRLTVMLGAANLFDEYPDEIPNDIATGFGARYPEFSPMGVNGGMYYARLRYSFD